MSTRQDGILSLKWKDKRDVLLLSTFHDDTMLGKSRQSRRAVGGVEQISKPRVVEDYNQFMGGVDRSKFGDGRVGGKFSLYLCEKWKLYSLGV